jgi:hypothetical protein
MFRVAESRGNMAVLGRTGKEKQGRLHLRLTARSRRPHVRWGIRLTGGLALNSRVIFPTVSLAFSCLFLVGCNSSAPPPQPAAPPAARLSYTPSDFQMPAGAGCTGDVSRWQAVQENDRKMGQVNDAVYAEIAGEIARAADACRAGRDAEARAMVQASKRRHGYPG